MRLGICVAVIGCLVGGTAPAAAAAPEWTIATGSDDGVTVTYRGPDRVGLDVITGGQNDEGLHFLSFGDEYLPTPRGSCHYRYWNEEPNSTECTSSNPDVRVMTSGGNDGVDLWSHSGRPGLITVRTRSGPDTIRFGGQMRADVRAGKGADTVEVHPGAQPSGRDRIRRVWGGPGADLLDVGHLGRDRVEGGRGADRLVVRDGTGNDRVSCGPGRDHVWLDRDDRVTDPRACETLTYGRRR